MSEIFQIKQMDTGPSLQVTCTDEDGDPVDLTGATVQLRLQRFGDEDATFTNDMVLVNAENGVVRYDWADGETGTPGLYHAEVLVTIASRVQTYPSEGFIDIEILLNAALDDEDENAVLVFCTAAQARTILGVGEDVTLAELTLAQLVISLRTGIQPNTDADTTQYDGLPLADKIGLRQATALQARWLQSQSDFLDRMNVLAESAAGASYQYTATAKLISPLAEWALKNTSFNESSLGVVNLEPEKITLARQVDNNAGWRPMK